MTRGRKSINPALRHVKTGLSIPPELLVKLDKVSAFTGATRSAIVCALLSGCHCLDDVLIDLDEAVYSREQGDSAFEIGGTLKYFLNDLISIPGVPFVFYDAEQDRVRRKAKR